MFKHFLIDMLRFAITNVRFAVHGANKTGKLIIL